MIVTFGFTGTITSGTDNSGIFDAAGTNLTGKPFALSISVDDTKGLPTNGVGGTGIAAITPAAVIAIDGKNYVFSSIQGQIDRGNNPGPTGSLTFGFQSVDSNDQINISITSVEDGAPYLATDNWESPFPLYTLVPFALQVPPSGGPVTASGETQIANFAIKDTSNIASGTLNIQTVSETVAANAPAMAFIADNPTMLAASASSIGALDVDQNTAPPLSAGDLFARMSIIDMTGAASSLTLPTPLSIDAGSSAMASTTADLRSEMSGGIKIDGSW